MDRREFVKIATIGSAVIFQDKKLLAQSYPQPVEEIISGSGQPNRIAIPSACWQCVSRCAIVGYMKDNRLVKIEGNPLSMRNEGKVCAKGQAGINQLYNPDRILYPLKRIGERGSGKWERISWDEAMSLLIEGGNIEGHRVKGLKTVRQENTPEKFLFHYGRMVGSDYTIINDFFLNAYGTASIGNHDAICSRAGSIAQMLAGDVAPSHQLDDARIVLNFGRNPFEAGLDHVPNVRRLTRMKEKGTKLITFDVRLSNTAAKSDEWIPVKPGTDLAVVLSLCQFMLTKGLYDKSQFESITNVTIEELTKELQGFTPEWAETISGVPASTIKRIAHEYFHTKPGACISMRGAFMHYNGVQTQRAITMLEAIAGNYHAEKRVEPFPKWNYPFPFPKKNNKRLNVFSGDAGQYAITEGGISHQILSCINKGLDKPEVYMVYCHNPVYSNGDCDENARFFKDVDKVPFLVSVDVGFSETSMLADLILPDATYLERWTCESGRSLEGIPEYYIRQPMRVPMGESRNFVDVVCALGKALNLDLGFESAEAFVKETCNNTSGIKEAGGFDRMKKQGVWHDRTAKVSKVKRSQKIEIKSKKLEDAGFSALPKWMDIPGHQQKSREELILTTFKMNVHTQSRTQNCKWLTELFHENHAWINAQTAAQKGIENDDWIKITSDTGELVTKAKVTQGIHPEAIAISHHGGHWGGGLYASGKPSYVHQPEPDARQKWWKYNGAHVNKIIPIQGDPISGAMCWNDTLVKVEKI